jgi:predicted PurR-regulated permease PerM
MRLGGGRAENLATAVWRLLLRLTLVVATIYACYRLRGIITTIIIAAIIAYVLDPAVEWLCRRRLFVHVHAALSETATRLGEQYRRVFYREPVTRTSHVRLQRHVLRVYASLYVFLFFFVGLWYGGKMIVRPFVSQFRNASMPQNRKRLAADIKHRLADYDRSAPDWARSDKIQQKLRQTDFARAAQGVASAAALRVVEGAGSIVEVVILPVLAFYFLVDGRKLKHEFVSLTPRAHLYEVMRMLNEFNRIMRAFVMGQVLLCLLAGVVVGGGLAALGVPYPFVMGVLAGLTRAIPVIGPILGGIPILLLTLATKGMGTALGVLGFFTFLHFAESKFIMPLFLGDRMELHPVVIIVVLIVGGEIGGLLIGGSLGSLVGMFFAAPVAAIIRVMVRRYWLRLRRGGALDRDLNLALALPPVLETADGSLDRE